MLLVTVRSLVDFQEEVIKDAEIKIKNWKDGLKKRVEEIENDVNLKTSEKEGKKVGVKQFYTERISYLEGKKANAEMVVSVLKNIVEKEELEEIEQLREMERLERDTIESLKCPF